MNFLSLFAGIGGLDLGLERAGMACVGQVEIDPYCQRVLAKHWPEVPRHDDVRTAVEWWGGRPSPDVVCGGFPCQPVSEVGRQRAQDDEHWLWPAFAHVVDVLRPRYVLVENVSGLLTANRGRAFGDVVGQLAQFGYDAEWSLLPACALGAPHSRDRVFLVAYADPRGQQASGRRRGGDGETLAPRRMGSEHLPPTAKPRSSSIRRDEWTSEPVVGRMADGLSPELDRHRLRALGNAVVPQVAEYVGLLILTADEAAA